MIKSYLINMDRDTERLQAAVGRFSALGIAIERLSAVDGMAAREETYHAFMAEHPRNNKSWLRGQMGCFLSHYAIWRKLADSSEPYAAIFEDDLHITDDLSVALRDDRWIPAEFEVIRLETSTNRLLLSGPVLTLDGRGLHRLKSTSWCAGAYILKRETAQRLVSLPARYHDTTDAMLFSHAESEVARSLKTYQFSPAFCIQDKFFHESADKVLFSSNIELHPAKPKDRRLIGWVNLGKKALAGFYKTARGYRRVKFTA